MRRGKMLLPLLAVLFVLVVGFGYRLASGAEGDISVVASAINPQRDTILSVSIEADVGSKVLSAYAFTLIYDHAALSIASTDSNGDGIPDAIVTGSAQFGLPSAVNLNNTQGTVRINDFQTDSTAPKGLVKMVTINFKVIGNAGTTSSLSLSNITLSDSGSNAVASNPAAQSITVATAAAVPIGSGWSFIFISLLTLFLGISWMMKIKRKGGIIAVITIGLLTASFLAAGAGVSSAAYQPGDVNGDGSVDISDAFIIARFDAGLITEFRNLSTNEVIPMETGDASGTPKGDRPSGSGVDIIDALLIAQLDVGVISVLPVGIIKAVLKANPESGQVPLAVIFNTQGVDPTGATIVQFRLNFGDGSAESVTIFGGSFSHTYNKAGTYKAVLTITNNRGDTATDTVTITVASSPPTTKNVDASPSNGQVPLAVSFSGQGEDKDGSIVKYEWDYDGDGVYDWSSSTAGNTSHTYQNEGTFKAVFRVTDNDGLTCTAQVVTTAVRVGPPGSPTVTASASSVSGNAPLNVNFSGSATDPDGTPITLYEWDFDGDGVYDWSSPTTASTTYKYTTSGNFIASLKVTTSDGLTGIDQMEIKVGITASLSIAVNTINASSGETAKVNTQISARVPVSISIKDQTGAVVRKLVDHVTRDAGSYSDVWDGKDNQGVLINDGPYYAVMEYIAAGETKILDLTYTTGNSEFNPDRSVSSSTFDPFNDQFFSITFTINQPCQVSVFIGCFYENRRIINLLNKEPLGTGSYTMVWDGVDDQGELATYCSSNQVIPGVTAWTLPNNTIFIKGGRPAVSNMSITPNYFDPSNKDCSEHSGTSAISFTLSKVSNVSVKVYNLDTTKVVRLIVKNNLPSGNNVIYWDGKDDQGSYVTEGDYRVAVTATDANGNQSMTQYGLIRLYY